MKSLAVILMLTLAVPALGQGVRPDDVRMSADDLRVLLAGTTVEFFDGSKARYGQAGGYAYTYADDDPPFVGTYVTADDSTVCVTFDNGRSRCDTYVMAGERLTLVIADGTRFPVRSRVAD